MTFFNEILLLYCNNSLDNYNLFLVPENVVLDTTLNGNIVEKKGIKYININKQDTKYIGSPKYMVLHDVVPNNKQLSDTVNDLFNENIKIFDNYVTPSLSKAFGEIIKNYVAKMHSQFPISKLYT